MSLFNLHHTIENILAIVPFPRLTKKEFKEPKRAGDTCILQSAFQGRMQEA
jgi:hypothetical protein